MGISRIVSTDFWEDGLVTDSFSPEDKYFMLYLMTNPHSKQAGIYKLNKKIAAFELGYSVETVVSLLDRFENKYHRIIYSQADQEVAVLNAPKYNIVKGGKPVLDCIEKDLSEVKDKSLIARMYQHLKPYFEQSAKPSIQQVGEVWKKASDTFKEGSPIENDIDNDNDRIVDVSYNESSHESSPDPKPEKPDPKDKFCGHTFSEPMQAALTDWLTYKSERREGYKPTGLKSFMTQAAHMAEKYEEADIISTIQESMANNWKGICWDKLAGKEKPPKPVERPIPPDILLENQRREEAMKAFRANPSQENAWKLVPQS